MANFTLLGHTFTDVAGFKQTDTGQVLHTFVEGGSSFNLIHEEDLGELNITSTSTTTLKTIYIDPVSDVWRHDKIIFATVRDKNAPRDGYFYGTDNIILNRYSANGSASVATFYHLTYAKNANGLWVTNTASQSITSTVYGVYISSLNNSGRIYVSGRYASATTQTIDGDFTLKVYTLDWPEGSPFLA